MSEAFPTILAVWVLLVLGLAEATVEAIAKLIARRLRFGSRTMFQFVTCASLVLGGWMWLRGEYRWQLNAVPPSCDSSAGWPPGQIAMTGFV